MSREIIRVLEAWDLDDWAMSILQAGTVVSGCQILRDDAPGHEPYVMEFDCGGHRYSCPLFTFQPRTQALTAAMEEEPAECAAAV